MEAWDVIQNYTIIIIIIIILYVVIYFLCLWNVTRKKFDFNNFPFCLLICGARLK